jgi:hypothetical protein
MLFADYEQRNGGAAAIEKDLHALMRFARLRPERFSR